MCGHVTNQIHFISTDRRPMDTKLGKVLTYTERLPFLKVHDPFIVCRKVPQFKIIPLITSITPFFKIPPSPHLNGKSVIPSFPYNRNATVKLSSINTIHVKQQHNVGFFIFKFTLKYMVGVIKHMLGNVYI